jgi:hypothetical protein
MNIQVQYKSELISSKSQQLLLKVKGKTKGKIHPIACHEGTKGE